MAKSSIKVITSCPDCNAEIRFRKAPHLGQIVICNNCQTSLEVVRRDPVELDWAFEDPFEQDDDVDWDDDYDDDEDYDYDDDEEWDDWDDEDYDQ
jgi:lysine biosynthesis protein LysW